MDVFTDEYFMKKAIKQAQMAFEEGEVPIGAVIVCNKQIVAQAYNQTQLLNDVTAHAEILAITAASSYLGSKYLNDCTLYVTVEPCCMCAGALKWAQIGKIIYAAEEDKSGFMQYGKEILHPKTKVEFGLYKEECTAMMKAFFQMKRTNPS